MISPVNTPSTLLQAPQVVSLSEVGQLHVLPVQTGGGAGAVVLLVSPDGSPRVQLSFEGGDLVVDCLGGSTRLRTSGVLALEAEQLVLSATHELRLCSGGDIHLQAAGNLLVQADAVQVQALGGDVCVTANDDVRLEGERVRMNA